MPGLSPPPPPPSHGVRSPLERRHRSAAQPGKIAASLRSERRNLAEFSVSRGNCICRSVDQRRFEPDSPLRAASSFLSLSLSFSLQLVRSPSARLITPRKQKRRNFCRPGALACTLLRLRSKRVFFNARGNGSPKFWLSTIP